MGCLLCISCDWSMSLLTTFRCLLGNNVMTLVGCFFAAAKVDHQWQWVSNAWWPITRLIFGSLRWENNPEIAYFLCLERKDRCCRPLRRPLFKLWANFFPLLTGRNWFVLNPLRIPSEIRYGKSFMCYPCSPLLWWCPCSLENVHPFSFWPYNEGLRLFKDVLDSCLWGSTPFHSSSAYSCSRLLVVTWESKLYCPFFPARCRPDTDRQTSFGPSQLFSPCGKSCMH